MGSPWSPAGESVPPPAQPLPVGDGEHAAPAGGFVPPPSPSARRWRLIGMIGALLVVAIAATAAITYALTHGSASQPTPSATSPASPGPNPSPVTPPTYSQAEQAAAKEKLCHVFEVSVRGKEGQGGVVMNGDPNIPLILRKVNSVVAVQNVMTPAIPEGLKAAVQKYVDTSMDVTTAALGDTPVDEVNRLTQVGNDATYALADECGVPR